jgi:cysteine dioxygenase
MNLLNLENLILQNINSVNKLSSLQNLVKLYNSNDWNNYVCFDNDTYKKNLVCRHESFEIYVICWKKGQKSNIHDHPQNGCIMLLLDGELVEKKYDTNLNLIENNKLISRDIGYLEGNNIFHEIISKTDSISLHIYSPSLYVQKIYSS